MIDITKECGETFVDNKSGWKSITTAKELLFVVDNIYKFEVDYIYINFTS